jgi:Spy/CpxP family protein refolding chaperone
MIPQSVRRHALGALAVGCLISGVLMASRLFAGSTSGAHGFSSEKMANHLAKQVGLSDTQTQQVKQVIDSHQDEMTARFGALRTARQALRSAAETSPLDDGAVRTAAQALAQAEGDSAILHAQIHSQILPILTDEQRQKFSALHEGGWRSHSHRSE